MSPSQSTVKMKSWLRDACQAAKCTRGKWRRYIFLIRVATCLRTVSNESLLSNWPTHFYQPHIIPSACCTWEILREQLENHKRSSTLSPLIFMIHPKKTNENVILSFVNWKALFFEIFKESITHIKQEKLMHWYHILYHFVFQYWQNALFC